MPKTRRIIVVGAGLGGLAATVGLRRRGFEVEVYEQAPELGEIGAGINITPNGAKVLNAFGLGDEARRLGNIGSELTMCDMKTDARLFGFAWSEFEARYGQPQYPYSQRKSGLRQLGPVPAMGGVRSLPGWGGER